MAEGHVAPITSSERIGELDALRGFALLGVFVVNYVFFFFLNFTAPDASREIWTADPANVAVLKGVMWLGGDKANTLFGTLFGIGFWVQMTRMQSRSHGAERIYLRRLTILLAMGAINLFLFWPWDILFVYALAGYALFLLRGLPMKIMLALGAVLFIVARPGAKFLFGGWGIKEAQKEIVFNSAATEARHEVILDGTYFDWVASYADVTAHAFLLSGMIVGWILYALGRFLLGAWLARTGWFERIGSLRGRIGRITLVVLPLGLAVEYVVMQATFGPIEIAAPARQALHMAGATVLAFGYATGLLWLYHSSTLGWIPRLFAPVGRMALTNYIAHGIVAMFVLSGIGPGLRLAGTITPVQSVSLAFGLFGLLTLFSHAWLRAYRYGPLEWAWRALTYGRAPVMRRQPASVTAAL